MAKACVVVVEFWRSESERKIEGGAMREREKKRKHFSRILGGRWV